MTTDTTPYKEQEALWYLGSLRIIQELKEQVGRAIYPVEHVLPAGTLISTYSCRNEDKCIYVVEGAATFSCEEKVFSATAGTLLFLPQNRHHRLEVDKFAPFRYLTWMIAPEFAHNVLHIGKPGQTLVLSPPSFVAQEQIQQLATLIRNAIAVSDSSHLLYLL